MQNNVDERNDVLTFQRFRMDEDAYDLAVCLEAAVDKLQTLYPGKKVLRMDTLTVSIETDSLYAPTGIDTYELGLQNGMYPAIRNTRSEEIITFRI